MELIRVTTTKAAYCDTYSTFDVGGADNLSEEEVKAALREKGHLFSGDKRNMFDDYINRLYKTSEGKWRIDIVSPTFDWLWKLNYWNAIKRMKTKLKNWKRK